MLLICADKHLFFFHLHVHVQSIQDWMLSFIVASFVFIDLVILITYTVVVWYTDDDALGVKEVVNVEDPDSVQGVSTNYITNGQTYLYCLG